MLKKNLSTTCFLMLLIAVLGSCKDFIEPSLEKREVILKAPANGTESNKYQVGFWWEPVADALSYRLQIATPDFDAPVSLVKDTLTDRITSLQLTLEPGKYEWRVRAENGSSVSKYSAAAFVIHESSLIEQKVTLIAPGNGYLSNLSSVALSWDLLFGAEGYLLQIDTLNFADETKLVYNNVLTAGKLTFNFPKDGSYQWRVKAENDTETSKWSETRLMTYDKTPPGKVSPVAPAKGAVVSQPVSISWSAVATAKKYKLYLYKSDSTTPYNNSFPLLLNGTSYSFNIGQPGELVYWEVSAIDEAGNEGALSTLMNFTIQ